MNTQILNRRSVRKYKNIPVPKHVIEEVLQAGILAPSSKNRQPWRFVVVSGQAKSDMLDAMRQGLAREKSQAFLPGSRQHLSGAEYTLQVMQQAPVTIFIINTLGVDLHKSLAAEERVYEICNAQSIGAAIENMSLMATELGLGSLWICDTFFAYQELCDWLDAEGVLMAAMTLGYADECPPARPRKKLAETVDWRIL